MPSCFGGGEYWQNQTPPKYDSQEFTDQEKQDYDRQMIEIIMQAQNELQEMKERILARLNAIHRGKQYPTGER